MSDDLLGPAFPFRIDSATGGVAKALGDDKIHQNVRVVLGTRVGERPMLREFGSRIAGLVQDPNDAVLTALAKNQVQQALMQWEPRILVLSVEAEASEGELSLRVTYMRTDSPVTGELTVPLR